MWLRCAGSGGRSRCRRDGDAGSEVCGGCVGKEAVEEEEASLDAQDCSGGREAYCVFVGISDRVLDASGGIAV